MHRAISEIITTEILEIGFGGKASRRKYSYSPHVSWKSRRFALRALVRSCVSTELLLTACERNRM
jgi:hypothetical protein